MAADDPELIDGPCQQLSGPTDGMGMAQTMEPVASDTEALPPRRGDRVGRGAGRHGGVEGGVEARDRRRVRSESGQLPDQREGGRVVQRRQGGDLSDRVEAVVGHCCEVVVDPDGVIPGDEAWRVAVALEQTGDLLVAGATENGRVRDLVAVEVEDREHRAVADGVEEPDALPRAFQGRGLRLSVADHAGDDETGVVEGGAERVDERIAQLASFVDRTRRGRADVARHAPRVENCRKRRSIPSASRETSG